MLTYYVVDDLRTAESQDGDAYSLLDRAIRAYRMPLSNRAKALCVRRDEETMDLVRCLPTTPRSPVGEDVLVLDFLDHPDWCSDRAVMLTARTLADKLYIRYCLFRGCLLPVPVTDKLPRNLQDKRLWSTVPSNPNTAVRWIDVAGVGRLSPAEFKRRYRSKDSAALFCPLVMRITAFVRKPNGRGKTLKLLPWEFHLMAKAQADEKSQ